MENASNARYKFAIIIGTWSIKFQMDIINSRLVNSLDNGSTSVTSSEITRQLKSNLSQVLTSSDLYINNQHVSIRFLIPFTRKLKQYREAFLKSLTIFQTFISRLPSTQSRTPL